MASIWEHSSAFRRSCEDRSAGTATEMDCVRQLVELIRPIVSPGMTFLDVGCAAGHYYHSLKPLGIEYYGIDFSPTAIEIGKRNMPRAGLAESRLRCLALEDLPWEERYDIVLCFNTLMYIGDYTLALENLCRAAKKFLIIRDSFDNLTQFRWEADILLDEGYQHLHAHFNIYGKAEIKNFLALRGFSAKFEADWRRINRFEGRPEVVGGISFPYEILLAWRQ